MNIDEYLSRAEQQLLKTSSDWSGISGFLVTWGIILAAGAGVAIWTNPVTVIAALIVFANRQMALGVLLHDCSHRSWFRSQALNDFFGHWFAGLPVLVPLSFYRRTHFAHHTKTGTKDDPDVGNICAYPVKKKSMRRKLFRDFSGQSGLKNVYALLFTVNTGRSGKAASMGLQKQAAGGSQIWRTSLRNFGHLLLVHGIWIFVTGFFGQWQLYVLWWIAFIFVYPFILRLRQVAEHAVMPMLAAHDVRENTRTTLVSWWERLIFAPHFVNYHCEHHSLPTVAGYRLPLMHKLLKDRGFYQNKPAALATGYAEVFRYAQSG